MPNRYNKEVLDAMRESDCVDSFDDQIKRQKRASSCTILDLNRLTETAHFLGSNGEVYDVDYDSCTCVDFRTRGLPCKHIYRLRKECGYIIDNTALDKLGYDDFEDKSYVYDLDTRQFSESSEYYEEKRRSDLIKEKSFQKNIVLSTNNDILEIYPEYVKRILINNLRADEIKLKDISKINIDDNYLRIYVNDNLYFKGLITYKNKKSIKKLFRNFRWVNGIPKKSEFLNNLSDKQKENIVKYNKLNKFFTAPLSFFIMVISVLLKNYLFTFIGLILLSLCIYQIWAAKKIKSDKENE